MGVWRGGVQLWEAGRLGHVRRPVVVCYVLVVDGRPTLLGVARFSRDLAIPTPQELCSQEFIEKMMLPLAVLGFPNYNIGFFCSARS